MKTAATIATAMALAALLGACQQESNCRAAFGPGAILDLTMPQWYDLTTVGGSTTVLNRGYKGIYITCTSMGQYAAYDCSCPNNAEDRLLPDTESNFGTGTRYGTAVLHCPECNALYNAIDGQPLAGSTCPLYNYTATLDGSNLIIN